MAPRLRVTVDGPAQAPGLVLANPLGTTSEVWNAQVGPFGEHFRLVRYEPIPRASVVELAADVVSILDRNRLERVSICGLSLGAMVAMELASTAPSRIDRLVLACTSARFGAESEWARRAAFVRAHGMRDVADDALDKWLTPSFRGRERFLEMQLAVDPDDYALGLEAIGGFDLRARLAQIRAPTLVIAGALDTATTPADARLIADGIPAARLVVLEGAAHLANVERSAAFNAAVLDHLLTRLPASRMIP